MSSYRFERKLPAHFGCVNCVAYNSDGSVIVSGSDDRHLQIYNTESGHLINRFATKHTKNIFSCKFLTDGSIISCSLDGSVQYHPSLDGQDQSHVFKCHLAMTGTVLKVSDQVFMSCSGDGTVNQYDLRIRDQCTCEGCNLHTLIDVNAAPHAKCGGCDNPRIRMSKSNFGLMGDAHRFLYHGEEENIGVLDIDIDPLRPHLIAVGCSDSFVRVFDKRKLKGPTYTVNSKNVVRPRSLKPAHGQEDDPVDETSIIYPASIECYEALSYSFCPSHIRQAKEEVGDYVDGMMKDGQYEPLFDVLHYDKDLRYPSIAINQDNEVVQKSFVGNGICSVKWFQDMLLVGFQDENVYLIQPSALLDKYTKWPKSHGTPFNLQYHCDWLQLLSKKERKLSSYHSLFGNFDYLRLQKPQNDQKRSSLILPLYRGQFAYEYDRDILAVFTGHKNFDTVLKRSNFILEDGQPKYVTQGSDDGFVYIWDINTNEDRLVSRKPISIVTGDASIVNCVVPHPNAPYLAVSGLQSDVKILSPVNYGLITWKEETAMSLQSSSSCIGFSNNSAQYQVERNLIMQGVVTENIEYMKDRNSRDLELLDNPFGFPGISDYEDEYSDEDYDSYDYDYEYEQEHEDYDSDYMEDEHGDGSETANLFELFSGLSVQQIATALSLNPPLLAFMKSTMPPNLRRDFEGMDGVLNLAAAFYQLSNNMDIVQGELGNIQSSNPPQSSSGQFPPLDHLEVVSGLQYMVDEMAKRPDIFTPQEMSKTRRSMPMNLKNIFDQLVHAKFQLTPDANGNYQRQRTSASATQSAQPNQQIQSQTRVDGRPVAQARNRSRPQENSQDYQTIIDPNERQQPLTQTQRQQQDILATLMQLNGRNLNQ